MEVEGPGGARFELATARGEADVTITRRLRVPFMRVPTDQYEAFATFCRATDLAEGSELRLRIK